MNSKRAKNRKVSLATKTLKVCFANSRLGGQRWLAREGEGRAEKPLGSQTGDDRIAVFETLVEAREQFGENFGSYVFRLTRAQIQAVLDGKVVAFDISGREYAGFLTLLAEADSSGEGIQ